MAKDPYQTESVRPMSELTRDLLLIGIASMVQGLCETQYAKHPEWLLINEEIKKLVRVARQEMGLP